jgi:hypothetical protein
VKNNVM